MAVTIINTLADNAVALRNGVPLANMTAAIWTRPHPDWADPAVRAAPWLKAGPTGNFLEGEIITTRLDAPPGDMPAGKKLGTPRTEPLVDTEALTAVWYTLEDLSTEDVAAAVTAAWQAKKGAINAERERRIYLLIGPIDLRGDGSLLVEPDIRNAGDRDNLIAIHTRALSLQAAGVTAAVMPFGAADNVTYVLTPAEALKLCEAPFDRASQIYQLARDLKDGDLAAALAAEDVAAIEAIDETDDAYWTLS